MATSEGGRSLRSVTEELARLVRDGHGRRLRAIDPQAGSRAEIDGRSVVVLASNDYLGLAGDPRLASAAQAALVRSGTGAGAARLVTGTRREHQDLEADAARLAGASAALTFASGFAANLAVLGAILGPEDLAVSDELNHASLIDGLRLTRAVRRVVRHADAAAFADALADADRFRRVVLVTEGVFSMDGDTAPLADLAELAARRGALLVVDDAHGFGVLGSTGGGAAEAAGIVGAPGLVRVGTFGKAFGAAGAFVAGDRSVIDLVVHRGRAFVFSTATPPSVAAAAREGIRIAGDEPDRRARCLTLAKRLAAGLRERGIAVPEPDAAIVPVVIGDARRAVAASDRLLADHGFLAPAIRPPTVPEGTSRLRVAASAAMADDDVERAIAALAEVAA